jgi:ketosteroid isomerase-like protein
MKTRVRRDQTVRAALRAAPDVDGNDMDPKKIANLYYDTWINRAGDMTDVPLAADFTFRGPVASFDDAAGYRQMAAQAGKAVTSFRIRHQFADGDLVCTVVDWEMAPVPGVLTAAEVLEIRDGQIVRGELIYDAEELRKAMT